MASLLSLSFLSIYIAPPPRTAAAAPYLSAFLPAGDLASFAPFLAPFFPILMVFLPTFLPDLKAVLLKDLELFPSLPAALKARLAPLNSSTWIISIYNRYTKKLIRLWYQVIFPIPECIFTDRNLVCARDETR